MSFLKGCAVFTALASTCFAQLPDLYKKIGRVTWVVRSIERPVQGWTALGLTDIRDFGEFTFRGEYRGKPGTWAARGVTGNLGSLAIDMLEPAQGDNAFHAFLAAHGDGVFSIVHEVANLGEMAKEVARMRSLGVAVLQTASVGNGGPVFTFFDTEPEGKYVLGLAYWPDRAPATSATQKVSHIAFVIRDPASVSAYWEKLGFPAMPVSHASPREDSRYRGKPLLLPFDVGWHSYSQPGFEWIVPPQNPPNCYADALKIHGEGVHHLGLPVDDLDQATAAYGKLGYSILQSGAWGEAGKKNSGRYAYMDTDAIGGVTAELIRAIN